MRDGSTPGAVRLGSGTFGADGGFGLPGASFGSKASAGLASTTGFGFVSAGFTSAAGSVGLLSAFAGTVVGAAPGGFGGSCCAMAQGEFRTAKNTQNNAVLIRTSETLFSSATRMSAIPEQVETANRTAKPVFRPTTNFIVYSIWCAQDPV